MGDLFFSIQDYPEEVLASEVKEVIGIPRFLQDYRLYRYVLETDSVEGVTEKYSILFLSLGAGENTGGPGDLEIREQVPGV